MPELNLRRLLIKNTGAQMVAQAVSMMAGLTTSFVLSRYLGVEGFGQFNYVFAFFYFLMTINDLGVNTIVVRDISREPSRANEIIGAMISFKILLSVASVAVAWTSIWLMHFPAELSHALYVFALVLPIIALQLPTVIFQVLLRAEILAAIGIFNRCAGLVLMMLMVWLGRGLTAIVTALIVAEAASLFVAIHLSRRFVRPALRIDVGLWVKVMKSSIPLGTAGLFVALINRVDFLMLERMTDLGQVGLYSAAYKVTNLLEAFPLMIMGTLYPLMSRYAGEDMVKLRSLYEKSVFYLALIAIPMGVCITLFAPAVLRLLFGVRFVAAAPGLRLLVWSTVFLYVALSGGNLLISVGREKVNMTLNAIGAGLNVGLNLFLIPRLGFVGAALATSATYLFILIGVSAGSYVALYSSTPGAALGLVKNAKA